MLKTPLGRGVAAAAMIVGILGSGAAMAQDVTVGALRFTSSGPIFIAFEQGYFEEAGLNVSFEFFTSAQAVAEAIAAGDVDFGVTAFTAGFYNLAGQGDLKVIGAQLQEVDGYDGSLCVASNAAYEAGLTSMEALPGRSYAMTTEGSSFHYFVGQAAEHYGFDLAEVDAQALGGVGNMIGGVREGTVDAMCLVPHITKPMIASGAVQQIGAVADFAPYQVGGLFTSTANVENARGAVEAFVTAYTQGIDDYRAAFLTGSVGQEDMLAIIHNYVYRDEEAATAHPKIANGAMYIEEGARMDVADIAEQIRWYQDQGLVDGGFDWTTVVDVTFVEPLTMPN